MKFSFFETEKKHKFNNIKVEFDGIIFDSKLELKMYHSLLSFDIVQKINVHVSFVLKVNRKHVCAVEPDFQIILKNGEKFYADAKSDPTETAVSKLKFKLFEAIYGEKIYILPRQFNMLEREMSKS